MAGEQGLIDFELLARHSESLFAAVKARAAQPLSAQVGATLRSQDTRGKFRG